MNAEIAQTVSDNKMSPEAQAKWDAIFNQAAECNQVLETNPDKVSKASNQARGMMLECLVDFVQEGVKHETEQGKVKSPAKIRCELLSLPESVSSTFGVVEMDNEHQDSELTGKTVVDVHNRPFDMATQSKGVKVLKVKIRYGFDVDTQVKYGKDKKIKERPIYRIMYVYPGDIITSSIFQVEKPDVELGSLVLIRGARCSAYFNTSTGMTGVSWQINSVEPSHGNLEDKIIENVLATHMNVPRNSHEFMKITEAPIDYSADNASDMRLSPELSDFLNHRVLFASWPTDTESHEKKMAHMTKKRNIIWFEPKFSHTVDDYVLKVTKDNTDKSYIGVKFRQLATVISETDKNTTVLNEVDILQRQARQLLGIASPAVFGRLAPVHAREIRFLILAKPNHKKTFESDMNSEAARDEDTSKFDYKIVWTPAKTAFMHSNLRWYVTKNGYPVTFDFVKEIVGRGSTSAKSEFSNVNYFNNVSGERFVNLTEYTGDLNKFSTDYVFFVLDARPIDQDRLERVEAIADLTKRAEACTASLLGKASRESDPVRLGQIKGNEPVVYALHKNLFDNIQAEEDKYSLKLFKDHIEKVHLEHDPADNIEAHQEALRKRKRDSTQDNYDESKHFRPSSSASSTTTSLMEAAAQVDSEATKGNDDAEASV